ncbi:MAG: hypothetical protein Q8Q42_04525 [Nanoarchaeota archaeon]|nr:hypothetical protein [Nanoarchaeota archaeon]
MATILDASGFGSLLGVVFTFILVFAATFAVMKKVKFFGKDNSGLDAIMAFVVAFFTIMIPEAQVVISSFLPWIAVFFMVMIAVIMFFMFVGVKDETITENVLHQPFFITIVVAAIVIIFLVSMTKAFGSFLTIGAGFGFWETTKRFLFSRRFLGLIFMLFVAAYTILFLTQKKS